MRTEGKLLVLGRSNRFERDGFQLRQSGLTILEKSGRRVLGRMPRKRLRNDDRSEGCALRCLFGFQRAGTLRDNWRFVDKL